MGLQPKLLKRYRQWGARMSTSVDEQVRKLWAWKNPATEMTEVERSWPLHAKQVARVTAEMLELGEQRSPSLRFLWDVQQYEPLMRLQRIRFPPSQVTEHEMQTLVARGFFEETVTPKAEAPSMIFTVAEKSKRRRRVVQDCLPQNLFLPKPERTVFTRLEELRTAVWRGTHAAVIDLAAWYWQIPLQEAVRDMFAFRVGNKFYRPTVLPMGFKYAVNIGHTLTTLLVDGVRKVFIDVYIDGVLLIGDYDDVLRARQLLLSRAKKFGVTLSEDTGVRDKVVFRGVELDMAAKTVRLAQSFMDKMVYPQRVDKWMTWRSAIGKAIYAMIAIGVPLTELVQPLRFAVRHTRTPPKKLVTGWLSMLRDWQVVVERIQKNAPRAVLPAWDATPAPWTIIGDAATETSKGAALLVNDVGRVYSLEVDFKTCHRSINEMELLTLVHALQYVAKKGATMVDVVSDSAVALAALRRQYSMSYGLNEAQRQVNDLGLRIRGFYVPSKRNPADAPSRCCSTWDAIAFDEWRFWYSRVAGREWGGGVGVPEAQLKQSCR